MNRKWVLFLIALLIIAVIFATLVAVNFQGWGASLAGVGGPVAEGIYNVPATFFRWALSGGWPTMGAALGGIAIAFCVFFYLGWHYDVPYKLTGTSPTDSKITGYIAQREPEDPETVASAGIKK